jgi:hypothetical protein
MANSQLTYGIIAFFISLKNHAIPLFQTCWNYCDKNVCINVAEILKLIIWQSSPDKVIE